MHAYAVIEDANPPLDQKQRENRLRAKADRLELRLMKSRERNPHGLTYGGYQLK